MKKIWYTQTSRDSWWPIFFFTEWGETFRLRLAGNPILLLESYYNLAWWESFMATYKTMSEGGSTPIDSNNLKALKKAKKQCSDFISAIIELQKMKKSLLVIYKE